MGLLHRNRQVTVCLMQIGLLLAPLPSLAASTAKHSLLKPLAPQMDVATPPAALPPTSPEPSAAPEMVHHNYDHARNSTLDAAESPVADLLQQAIDAHSHGNSVLAERLFKDVLPRDGQNTDALYNLGAIAEEKGNLEGALMDYQAALKTSPSDGDIQQAVGSIQNRIQARNAAKAKAAQDAMASAQQQQQQTQLKKLASDAAQAYKSGNYDLAVKNLETVAQQAPNDPDVRFGLAQAYRGKGDFSRARSNLNQALAIDPGNSQYQQALQQLGQQEQASAGGGHSAPAAAGGFPPAAPDFHGGGSGSWGSRGYGAGGSDSGPLASAGGDEDPEGGVTPFTEDATQSAGRHYGHAQSYGYGGGLSNFIPGGFASTGASYYGGMSGGSRMQRAAINGLAGAAMGGLSSRMMGGSFKSGAIMGGLMGLFMGGF